VYNDNKFGERVDFNNQEEGNWLLVLPFGYSKCGDDLAGYALSGFQQSH